VAEDPNGLDRDELLRLVKDSLSISKFNPAKLSKDGVVMTADNETGIQRRNSMHNRVKSDAFVPAGGRPNTINADNWRNFLDANGVPSSKLIVEGANIFTTPEARQGLFDVGKVAIVKDSSANKVRAVRVM
jgi:glutamate dehydrogenase